MPKPSKSDLKAIMDTIQKRHGADSVMQIGRHKIRPIDSVSTGSLTLDLAIGVGGFPRGRITEISGPEAGGKTTMCLEAVAAAQAADGMAGYIDAEHSLNIQYAKCLGVDIDAMLFSQPDYGEQALDIAEAMIESGMMSIVVIDSVAALVPKAELEGEAGDVFMGLQARMMGKAMRRLAGKVRSSNTALVFVNQIREKIGVMFGSNEVQPGGRALKFAASLRVDIRRVAELKDGDKKIGSRTKFRLNKNKVGMPFQEGEFDLIWGQGISRESEIVDLGADEGIIEKSGSWFSYKGERVGQGRENARQFLQMNPDIAKEIEVQIRTKYRESGRLA